MRFVMALALLLLVAPAAFASDVPMERATAPDVVQPLSAADVPVAPALHLDEIQIQQRSVADSPAAAQQMPPRGSFWWMVAAVVVAGVILVVLV
jgi:hypothetical protein